MGQGIYVPQVGEIVRVVEVYDQTPSHKIGDIQRWHVEKGQYQRHPSKPLVLLPDLSGQRFGTWCRVEKWFPRKDEVCRGLTPNKGFQKTGEFSHSRQDAHGVEVAVLSSGSVLLSSLEPVGMLKKVGAVMDKEKVEYYQPEVGDYVRIAAPCCGPQFTPSDKCRAHGTPSLKVGTIHKVEANKARLIVLCGQKGRTFAGLALEKWVPKKGEPVLGRKIGPGGKSGNKIQGAFQRLGGPNMASIWYGGHEVAVYEDSLEPICEPVEAGEEKAMTKQEFYGTQPPDSELPKILPEGAKSIGGNSMGGWVLADRASRGGLHYQAPDNDAGWNRPKDVNWSTVRREPVAKEQDEQVDKILEKRPVHHYSRMCSLPACSKGYDHSDPETIYCSADCAAQAMRDAHLEGLQEKAREESRRQQRIYSGATHYLGHDLHRELGIMSKMLSEGRHKKGRYRPDAVTPPSQHPVAWPEGAYDDVQELCCS